MDDFVYNESLHDVYWNKTVKWSNICKSCSLDLLKKHSEDVDWYSALENPNMTEEFIHNNRDIINFDPWIFISCSMEFLEKFEDKIDFVFVSENVNLNQEFIKKHKDKLDLYSLNQRFL